MHGRYMAVLEKPGGIEVLVHHTYLHIRTYIHIIHYITYNPCGSKRALMVVAFAFFVIFLSFHFLLSRRLGSNVSVSVRKHWMDFDGWYVTIYHA